MRWEAQEWKRSDSSNRLASGRAARVAPGLFVSNGVGTWDGSHTARKKRGRLLNDVAIVQKFGCLTVCPGLDDKSPKRRRRGKPQRPWERSKRSMVAFRLRNRILTAPPPASARGGAFFLPLENCFLILMRALVSNFQQLMPTTSCFYKVK